MPIPPPPIVKVERPVCNLPALPQPMRYGPIPAPDGESWLLNREAMAELVMFEAGERAWIEATQACLAVKP